MLKAVVRQCLRHVVATAVLGGALALGSALLYFVLLAIAIVFNLGLGGPLALPFMIIVGGLIGLAAGPLVLFPLTVFVEWLCKLLPRFKTVAQIPVSTTLLLVLLAGLLLFASYSAQLSLGEALGLSLFVIIGALLALGVYWWTLRVLDLLAWPLRLVL